MIKNIKYGGYAAQPDAYEASDGQLDACVNLINEDGSLKPIEKPKIVGKASQNDRILLIHSVPGQKNFIIFKEDPFNPSIGTLCYIPKDDPTIKNDTSKATIISSFSGLKDVVAVGNTLAVATSDGVTYILWRDGAYRVLGKRPPFIAIDFGCCVSKSDDLRSSYFITSQKDVMFPGAVAAWTMPGFYNKDRTGKEPYMAWGSDTQWKEVTTTVFGCLNKALSDHVTSKGYFHQPFFVRYAFRLFDQTYAWHSSPILMTPSMIPPSVLVQRSKYKSGDSDKEINWDDNVDVDISVTLVAAELCHRILMTQQMSDELQNWKDIISGIDVFVSSPIYSYDNSKDLDKDSGADDYYNATTSFLRTFGYEDTALSQYLFGHFSTVAEGAKYEDRSIGSLISQAPTGHIYRNLILPPKETFLDDIRDCHLFYRVAEIDFDDIKPTEGGLQPLTLKVKNLTNLETRPRLEDDYQSHATMIPESLTVYNSRLHMSGCTYQAPAPLPIRSLVQYAEATDNTTAITATVYTRSNGIQTYRTAVPQSNYEGYLYDNTIRWLFHPDPSAYCMVLKNGETILGVYHLKTHDFLNGAYYFADSMLMEIPVEKTLPDGTHTTLTEVELPSKVYSSEADNPFVFPSKGTVTVGSGKVMALCAAVRALSQGQFGQFPLYAFSSDGVWSMSVTSEGTYNSVQPVTRDVCLSKDSITQLDTTVLFVTDRGIMQLSGSSTSCISDAIDSGDLFSIASLPHGGDLLKMANLQGGTATLPYLGEITNSIEMIPFGEFILDCRGIYDYIHQRILFFNPKVSYAYVYAIKSKEWGTMTFGVAKEDSSLLNFLRYTFNAYPEAYAVDATGALLDICHSAKKDVEESDGGTDENESESEGKYDGILVTRPLKLDHVDVLKTIDQLYQRGRMRPGSVGQILYGSNNLIDWYRIWDSNNARMRSFAGTPYKFFRVVVMTRLQENERLFGCSVSFIPRFTNHLR